jgi:transcriptional regulator with XRE-family HTH domain
MTREVTKAFGPRLKWWREQRGLSQLALSGAAEISQRHLSFLESSRAEPSRDMVLRLCAVLDVPLRQQNALLLAAGFAPVWRESDLSDPELAQVNGALGYCWRSRSLIRPSWSTGAGTCCGRMTGQGGS